MIRLRLRTLEAMAMVILARTLVRAMPLRVWKGWLGTPVAADDEGPVNDTERSDAVQDESRVRQCVAAIGRASYRLPGTICLPQAIGLQWMLRRRKIASTVFIGVLPTSRRDADDPLHAWVQWCGRVIIGDSEGRHATILKFRTIS